MELLLLGARLFLGVVFLSASIPKLRRRRCQPGARAQHRVRLLRRCLAASDHMAAGASRRCARSRGACRRSASTCGLGCCRLAGHDVRFGVGN